jgi:Flp pilus assembly protein TadG
MGSLRTRRRRSRSRDRGASLVEFALLSPLLFMLLFGILTGGLTLSRQNAVENSVREATRFGAVLTDFTAAGNLDDLYKQVVAAATGDLNPGVPNRQICVALIGEDNQWRYQEYDSTATPAAGSGALVSVPASCKEGFDTTVGTDTNRVWVRAQRSSEISAVLYNNDVTLRSHAMTRYER